MSKDLITYCPACFSPTLSLKGKGIVSVTINGKKMDNGRFLYELTDTPQEIVEKLTQKLEEFLKWYSRFYNIEPIQQIELTSNSFECSNRCVIKPNYQMSVIGILIPKDKLTEIIKEKAIQYNLEVELSL